MQRNPRMAALAGVMAAAGAAQAQCDFWVPYVPDFDQKRTVGPGTPALPNDGAMYCVPTSVTNWFAYFANRGIPQPAMLAGPRVWQSNTNYNRVTNALSTMGGLMGTDPQDGTNGNDGLSGAYFYSLAFAQGKVTVSHYWCGGGYCPTPARIALKRALGGYVAACYGRYTESPAGFFTRSGGHCITVNGEVNVCSGTPYLQFRDPADDGYNSTQSTFTTRAATMTNVSASFRGKSSQTYSFTSRWRLNYGNTGKYLDGWYVLDPIVSLTYSNLDSGQLLLHRPFRFDDSALPAVQTFATPAGTGPVTELVMHPQGLDYYYVTGPVPGGAAVHRMFHLDPVSGVSTPVLSSTSVLKHLVCSRHGEIYTCDGSVLKRFSCDGSVIQLLGSRTLTTVPEAMAYEDAADSIATLTPTGVASRHSLTRYSRNMDATLSSYFLANLPPISGEVSMDFRGEDGHLFVAAMGNPVVFHYNNLGTVNQPNLLLPAGYMPQAVNVGDDGDVMFVHNGVIHEYMETAGAGWVIDGTSIFAGLPAGGRMNLSRSRTNHEPALHEGPEWANIRDPEIAPGGIADCYANCDGSTVMPVLNVNDFTCYTNLFAAGRIEANCDESTATPVLNVNDFTCFLNNFAQGCL
ncbi:MAG: GC-type dockerin domain-anchored protein [Phycisphaerales bacterium]